MKSILLLTLMAVATILAVPSIPQPTQYIMSGTFEIPYFNIVEPITLAYDSINNRQFIDYYQGLDVIINLFNQDLTYTISPRVYEMTCTVTQGNGTLINVIPNDPTNWIFNGTALVNNVQSYSFTKKISAYGRTGTYTFYIDANGNPIQFYLNGVDTIFDSHPDIYILNFATYTEGPVAESYFAVPELCNGISPTPQASDEQESTISIFGTIGQQLVAREKLHRVNFADFKNKYNRNYQSNAEHEVRFNLYKKAANMIDAHNAKGLSYTLAVNQFADMTDEEFHTRITPKNKRPENNGAHSTHDNEHTISLPATVDWRQQNCVTPVKDQGVCGSCWTFGSTGSLEGTYCVKHNSLISLSEQQLVDCAYIMESQGCNGGFASSAFQYIMNDQGISTEAAYPYLMQNGICKDRYAPKSGVTVASYVNVTSASEAALQNAVATVGPVAVAIDASVPDFRYYSSGVYYSPACQNGPDDLDHEVLAIGYGTYQGSDYWLVKNSWSTNWGIDGYIMMARNHGNNCGISTQATYPIPN
ncbi:hypothetical protein CYY_007605 [Polysphondylium violaceum]|uniref:Counting factor associated protein D n=1 Tax=Polysphondylium violaceum TaxID=133409 RepID=A0A8J4V4S7_9MYCE|nr:hypothetical protein CYY_007605 [Polysphondylium violaceum]